MFKKEIVDSKIILKSKERIIKSTCTICQIGCGILVHVSDEGRITAVEGDPESPLNKGIICPKGQAALEYLYHPDRLKQPLKRIGERGEDKWKQISWDEALDTITAEFSKIKKISGAESIAFKTGTWKGDLTDDYLMRFANLFGSPNILSMSPVCFMPRKLASIFTYGFFATNDFDHPPKAIISWGINPSSNLHHAYRRMVRAINQGTKLMVVNPFPIEGTELAEIWLKVRPATDLALALGMINVIVNEELYDKKFVEKWVFGFDELRSHVREYSPEKVSKITWVPAEKIRKAAEFYAANKPACLQWGNAIDHGVNNFQTARALCMLRAITGNLEIPGGDVNWTPPPVLHGSSSMTLFHELSKKMRESRITTKKQQLPMFFEAEPSSVIKAMKHRRPYPVRALLVHGSNPLLTYNNAVEVEQSLRMLDFLVVIDMFMTPTAALADIVLPAASFLECDGINCPNYSIPVSLVRQKVTRIENCRSDYEILRQLAIRLGFGNRFWETEQEALDFALAPVGINFEEFRKIGFLKACKQFRSYKRNGFKTPSKKVEVYSHKLKNLGFDPLPIYYEPPETPQSARNKAKEFPLIMTSGKTGCYRHTGGRQIARLRGIHPEPITIINTKTACNLGIKEGEKIYIETAHGKIEQKAALSSDIDPRVIMVDYAWWFPESSSENMHNWKKSNINILTGSEFPNGCEMTTPNLRGIMCRVIKVKK